MTEQLYTTTTVARRLGVAIHRIHYAHASGKLGEPPLRLAGKRIYTEADLRQVAQYFGHRKKKAGHDE